METQDFKIQKDHSQHFLEMAFRTDRIRTLPNPDGYGKRTGACGDSVEFFLIIRNDRLESVFFNIHGCIHTNASCNVVSQLAEGKPIDQAWEISPEIIAEYLGTLPEDHYHCAELAAGAFYKALANYNELKREPWKQMYQKFKG